MIQMTLAGYTVLVAETMPERDEQDCTHAALVDRFGSDTRAEWSHRWADDDLYLHVEVRRGSAWPAWPILCVAQHYRREGGGHPGVLLVPETAILFIGAGERLLAYDVHGPARLWEDQADTGFHEWQRHDDLVVMSAELELAAWNLRGVKRWSTFVEPPWAYHVEGSMVYLDVMGTVSSFPLVSGPARH